MAGPGACPAMKITRILPIGIVVLGLAASSAAASSPLTVTGKAINFAKVDVGTPGPSLGDQQIISMDVFKGAKRVGESHVVCTVVRTGFAQCDNVTSLPGGQIAASGVVTDAQEESSPFTQAITGGTGSYRNARGTLTVSEMGPDPAQLAFNFT
jgi:hypothetical protein